MISGNESKHFCIDYLQCSVFTARFLLLPEPVDVCELETVKQRDDFLEKVRQRERERESIFRESGEKRESDRKTKRERESE